MEASSWVAIKSSLKGIFASWFRTKKRKLLMRKEEKKAKALWDTNRGVEEKTKHAFKRPPLRDPLKHPLWTRFRFFLGAGLGHFQLVSQEAIAFSPLSSSPPKATIKYSLLPLPEPLNRYSREKNKRPLQERSDLASHDLAIRILCCRHRLYAKLLL